MIISYHIIITALNSFVNFLSILLTSNCSRFSRIDYKIVNNSHRISEKILPLLSYLHDVTSYRGNDIDLVLILTDKWHADNRVLFCFFAAFGQFFFEATCLRIKLMHHLQKRTTKMVSF